MSTSAWKAVHDLAELAAQAEKERLKIYKINQTIKSIFVKIKRHTCRHGNRKANWCRMAAAVTAAKPQEAVVSNEAALEEEEEETEIEAVPQEVIDAARLASATVDNILDVYNIGLW